MGFFSRWASFLFKALGWASFRNGLLFEIIFANLKNGLLSRPMLQILKLTTVKERARLLHTFVNHEVCLNVK